ncbi:hypothetical protein X777_04289, partial [Ooceraea biroi]
RNNALPKFHQITHDELELDLRIMTDLNKELEMEMTAVREKLAFKMERSELALQKLLEHFIHPITCLPQPDDIVYSLRQYILDTDVTLPHNSIENYVCITDDRTIRNRIREKEWRGLEEEGMKEKLKMTRAKEQPIANFSESINYKNADSNLGIQLKQMLRKYTLRKMKLEEREKKWKVIHSEKPDTSINHKHDVLIMEESEKTIGDYKLKTLSTILNTIIGPITVSICEALDEERILTAEAQTFEASKEGRILKWQSKAGSDDKEDTYYEAGMAD